MKRFRLLGAILLIAGTTIGAAMLALPVSTGRAGFFPSIATMIFVWLYLTYAAFCLLEVAMSLPKDSNIVTMAEHTLGKVGKWISWAAYLFLLYALNTAYLSGMAGLFQDIIFQATGYLPSNLSCTLPQILLFSFLLRGGIKAVDFINRIGMVGLFTSFTLLIALSVPHIQLEYLTSSQLFYVLPSLSIVVTAFGFHVVIPSLIPYLDYNVKELKKAIWIGSLIPLIAYMLWQTATLGIVPLKGDESIEAAYQAGYSGSQLLATVANSPYLRGVDDTFAFFAIVTSFLGVSMSLFDFLVDGMKLPKDKVKKWKILLFAFAPPLYFSLSYKRVFLSALEYAGAFGVVILLALIPALMTWRKRYVLRLPSAYEAPGGKITLTIFIVISVCFVILETVIKTAT